MEKFWAIVFTLWGLGFVLAGIWMILITLETRKQRREEASIKARFDAMRKAKQRVEDDKMFDNVLEMLNGPSRTSQAS